MGIECSEQYARLLLVVHIPQSDNRYFIQGERSADMIAPAGHVFFHTIAHTYNCLVSGKFMRVQHHLITQWLLTNTGRPCARVALCTCA